jgi:hypothetical protein
MKMLVILLLGCAGCTKTMESNATTEVYPHDPDVINKVNLGISMKGTW